jgi:hypothetical protein
LAEKQNFATSRKNGPTIYMPSAYQSSTCSAGEAV